MNAILRKVKANLRAHKLQAVLVFFTLFAAATLLTVALCTLYTAQGAFDRLFERTNAAHLWLLLDPVALPQREIEATLAEIPGVEATGRAYRTISTTLFLDGVRESGPGLRNWPDESDSVARPLLVDGHAPLPGETDAIVLDRNAAVEYGVDVGDTIGVLTPSGRQDLKVVGRFVSTEVCPTCFPFISYIAHGALAELGLLPSPDADVGALVIGGRPLANPARLTSSTESAPLWRRLGLGPVAGSTQLRGQLRPASAYPPAGLHWCGRSGSGSFDRQHHHWGDARPDASDGSA